MSKTTEIRTDGTFGAIYQELAEYNPKAPDVRDVVKTYAERHGKLIVESWADWFDWSVGDNSLSPGVIKRKAKRCCTD